MIGVILISHGEMATGMLNSCRAFFGGDIAQIEAICFMEQDSPEALDGRIADAIQRLDDGSGIMIFCDLIGGTPSNRCMRVINDHIKCISGANLAVVIEFLSARLEVDKIEKIDGNSLIDTARNGIKDLNEIVKAFQK